MEYQKIINLLDYTPNQPTKFRINWILGWNKWWFTWNNNTNSQIKFKTSMLRLNLHDYSDAYKKIAIDLSKPPALDDDPKALQQINFTENLDGVKNRIMFFFIEKKGTILDFSQGTVKVLWMLLCN